MREKYQDFERAGIRLVAVAVDAPEKVGALAKELDLPFLVYADPEHRLAEALGVYNLLRDDRAAPSVFVARGDGQITWRHVGRNIADRPPVEEVLRAALKAAT